MCRSRGARPGLKPWTSCRFRRKPSLLSLALSLALRRCVRHLEHTHAHAHTHMRARTHTHARTYASLFSESLFEYVGLFCGSLSACVGLFSNGKGSCGAWNAAERERERHAGLLYGYSWLFCGYVDLFCRYTGLFCCYTGFFCGRYGCVLGLFSWM